MAVSCGAPRADRIYSALPTEGSTLCALTAGDIRKVTKIKVAGQELEVETMMAEEDTETVKKPTGHYASRESFLVMRDTYEAARGGHWAVA